MSDPLTPIERKVYHYLLDFLAENTYQPSVREIGRRLRIRSTKTVTEILQSLADKGYVTFHFSEPLPVRGGRSRKHATLTASGRRALRDSVRALDGMLAGLELGFTPERTS